MRTIGCLELPASELAPATNSRDEFSGNSIHEVPLMFGNASDSAERIQHNSGAKRYAKETHLSGRCLGPRHEYFSHLSEGGFAARHIQRRRIIVSSDK